VVRIIILVCSLVTIIFSDEDAEKILDCLESSGLGLTSGFEFKQIIKRENQSPRTFQAECYLVNKADKLLIMFEEPADMSGVKLLLKNKGKQLWTYFPRTNRVRKMIGASSGQNIGSLGFSYNDIFPYLEENSYSSKLVGKEKVDKLECDKIEITYNSDSNSEYVKSFLLIDEQKCALRKSMFYGEKDRLLKTVKFSIYETVEDKYVPTKINITQPDKGEESDITILGVDFDKDYGSTFFSERSLKR